MDPLVGLFVALVLGGVMLYRTRRLAPDVPRRWRSSQSVAARLCRRLHRAVDRADDAVRRARKRGVPVAWIETAQSDLRACASAIDHRLVAASELPLSARHRTLLALRYRIVELEKAASRVVTMAAEAGRPDVDSVRASVQEVHQRLDRLEDARRELRNLG
ncbi:MAG: hypothetical protein QOI55_2588 [Actinomycetota bacterium]|jgi:nitrate reductase beta subunit|nr:hypothetical protein [Actinomycetota bacterium]